MRIRDWSSDVCSSDLARRSLAEAVRGKAIGREVINGTAARDIEEQECRDDRAEYLREDIKRNVARVETPACPQADGDCGVEVTARNMADRIGRSEEHTSELQSLMRNSYAVFCLKTKNTKTK